MITTLAKCSRIASLDI